MTNDKEIIVASFCAKCGIALSPNDLICKSCGTTTVAGEAVAEFIPPTDASDKSGSSTIKIILIIIAVIVGLGILGLGAIGYMGYRMVKNTHVDSSGRVTMNTPAGAIVATPAENFSASDLGVDIYPGAQSTKGSMKMEMPNTTGVTGVFLTSDSPAQVTAFYKDKLGASASVTSIFGTTMIQLKVAQKESVQVTIKANSSLDKGKTRISISHMKKKAE